MPFTAGDARLEARRIIRETVVRNNPRWTEDSLLEAVNGFVRELSAMAGQFPSSSAFTWTESLTFTASAEFEDLVDELTYDFAAIRTLYWRNPAGVFVPISPAPVGSEEALRTPNVLSGNEEPRYFLSNPPPSGTSRKVYLHRYPIVAVEQAYRVKYRYWPATMGEDDIVPLADVWKRLVALGCAMRALTEDGKRDKNVEDEYRAKLAQFWDSESRTSSEDRSPTIEDRVSSVQFGGV